MTNYVATDFSNRQAWDPSEFLTDEEVEEILEREQAEADRLYGPARKLWDDDVRDPERVRARMREKHLPGQHDQRDHGHRGAFSYTSTQQSAGYSASMQTIAREVTQTASLDEPPGGDPVGTSEISKEMIETLMGLEADAYSNNWSRGPQVFAAFAEGGFTAVDQGGWVTETSEGDNDAWIPALAQIEYDATQAGLKEMGVPEQVTLYRGIRGDTLTPHEGLSWCTTSREFAESFAGDDGHVFEVTVPRDAVMYTSITAPAVAQLYWHPEDVNDDGNDTLTGPGSELPHDADEWAVRASAITGGRDLGRGKNASWLSYAALREKMRS